MISSTRNKKYCCAFFPKCLAIPCFFLEIFSNKLTIQCFQCLLDMDKHIDEARTATFVGKSSRWNGIWKNICQKSTYIILGSEYKYFLSAHQVITTIWTIQSANTRNTDTVSFKASAKKNLLQRQCDALGAWKEKKIKTIKNTQRPAKDIQ